MSRQQPTISSDEIIEIGWEQIQALEADSRTTKASETDLGQSQTWEIIDTTSDERAPTVESELVEQNALTATVLYDTELRQLLIDDLEELECFLRQRQAEFTSKDNSFFSVYQQSAQSEEMERLRSATDQNECQNKIQIISSVLKELQDQRFIMTM